MDEKIFRLDGIAWNIKESKGDYIANPLCPTDFIGLDPQPGLSTLAYSRKLKCPQCNITYGIPREYINEQKFVINKVNSKKFKTMKILNLDDESIPIAENKISSKDNEFFIVSRLMESKIGLRLVVYAGKKGGTQKTQIFVEPGVKRLAFDQNDLHPTDVFTSLEAVFTDGTKSVIKKGKK